MRDIGEKAIQSLWRSFKFGGWFLMVLAGAGGFWLGARRAADVQAFLVSELNGSAAQTIILSLSAVAAVLLYVITAKTAQDREAMNVLQSDTNDRDLIENRRDFYNAIVWYKENLNDFAKGHEVYAAEHHNGAGIPKSPDDPRKCVCSCSCTGPCRGLKACQCNHDSMTPPRKLSIDEYVETRQIIIQRLNFFEYTSIGILSGAYREKILKDAIRSSLVQGFISAAPYIHAARTHPDRPNKKLFLKFEKVARRWGSQTEVAKIDLVLGR